LGWAIAGLRVEGFGFVGSLSDDPVYREIAEDSGTPLIDEVLAGVLSDDALKSDPIHPNAAGYRRVAEGIHQALQKQGWVQ
jgi:acyl-CoA hydrolase